MLYALLYSVGLVGLLNDGFTFSHWRAVLSGSEVWRSLLLSAGVAGSVTSLGAALGLAAALGLRPALRNGPFAGAVYLPLALPPAVAGFLVYQMLSGGGLLSRGLSRLGLLTSPWAMPALVQDRLAIGIVCAHVLLAAPFLTILFTRLFEAQRVAELSRAAMSLGASPWQSVWLVEVPVLLRAASENLALLFIAVLGSYEIPLLLGRQAPQMLSVLTLRKYALFDLRQKPEAFVIALLYALIVLAPLAWVLRRRGADAA